MSSGKYYPSVAADDASFQRIEVWSPPSTTWEYSDDNYVRRWVVGPVFRHTSCGILFKSVGVPTGAAIGRAVMRIYVEGVGSQPLYCYIGIKHRAATQQPPSTLSQESEDWYNPDFYGYVGDDTQYFYLGPGDAGSFEVNLTKAFQAYMSEYVQGDDVAVTFYSFYTQTSLDEFNFDDSQGSHPPELEIWWDQEVITPSTQHDNGLNLTPGTGTADINFSITGNFLGEYVPAEGEIAVETILGLNVNFQAVAIIETSANASFQIDIGFSGTAYINEVVGATGAVEIPLLETDSWGYESCQGSLDSSIPMLRLSAEGMDSPLGTADLTLRGLQLDGYGGPFVVGTADVEIPIFTLDGLGLPSYIGTADLTIPIITLSAGIYSNEFGTADLVIPSLLLSADIVEGPVGLLSRSIPSLRLDGYGLEGIIGTADLAIPMMFLDIDSDVAGTLTLCLNIKNKAMTIYGNYIFNSMCHFNGKNIGAKSNGLFELTGSYDNGVQIEWNFRTGLLDLEIGRMKKLLQLWFGYKATGDIKLKTIYADGQEYEYDLQSYSDSEHGSRVKIGKGIRTRYLSLDVSGDIPAEFDVIKLHFNRPGPQR